MRLLLLFMLIMTTPLANAEYLGLDTSLDRIITLSSVSIVSGLYTKHLNNSGYTHKDTHIKQKYNESNDYYGIKFNTESGYELSVSRFNNSYSKESYSVGIHKDVYQINNYTTLGADLFLSTGYKDYNDPLNTRVILVPAPYIKLDGWRFSGKVSVLGLSVVALSLEYKLWCK